MVEPSIVTNYDNGRRNGQSAKLRMLHAYIDTMRESGLTKEQINATLKHEELDLLAEEKFVSSRKDFYGKSMT